MAVSSLVLSYDPAHEHRMQGSHYNMYTDYRNGTPLALAVFVAPGIEAGRRRRHGSVDESPARLVAAPTEPDGASEIILLAYL